MKKKPSEVELRFFGGKKYDNASEYVLEEVNPLITNYKKALKSIEGLEVQDYLWNRSLVLILKGSDDNIISGLEAIFNGNLFPSIVYSSNKGYQCIEYVLNKYEKGLARFPLESAVRTITLGLCPSSRLVVNK